MGIWIDIFCESPKPFGHDIWLDNFSDRDGNGALLVQCGTRLDICRVDIKK